MNTVDQVKYDYSKLVASVYCLSTIWVSVCLNGNTTCICYHLHNIVELILNNLPVGQSLNFRPLFFIDGFVALNEGQIRLGCDMGGASVSRFKQIRLH